MKVTVTETTATVTINKESREYAIKWVDGMPTFVERVWVGVLIGKQGTKVWLSSLRIRKHAQYNPSIPTAAPQWVLDPSKPLNSLARNFYHVQVTDFWENVPDAIKSAR